MESSPTYGLLRPKSPDDFIPFPKQDIEQSIPSRFESQVRVYGKKIAVKTGGRQITYDELNTLANRIANYLLREQGDDQAPVALLCAQGIHLIAAILGILKAGRMYMPLDVYDPPARIEMFLRESGCSYILTDEKNFTLASSAAQGVNAGILNLDQFNIAAPEDYPSATITPETHAYIFYTSGSTGKPKGVVDNHRNVLHNIMRYTNALRISASDRLTLLQSANFSGSVSSLFCALLNGATVYPYDVKEAGLGKNIASWLKNERITIYHSVPAIFRSFVNEKGSFPDVRVIRLEGDAASGQDVELFRKYFSDDCVLVNGLGATETGIVRQYFVGKESPVPQGNLPIGYPVEDMEMFIVDEQWKKLPTGCTGEIAVRSKYLAVGYWRNEALTSASFKIDTKDPAIRTYKTGDMGRMNEDRCVEYLGRKDFQLKIRGNRVDPAEIESQLLKLPEIKDAVVVTALSQGGDGFLAAYLVPTGRPFPTQSYLKRRLKESLPEYMIPSRFILLDAFPLNANLKVDRKALPDPEQINRLSPVEYRAPRDPVEISLVEIWESIFKISPVGINDNFFDLGGDSLFAAQLYARVESEFAREIDMKTLLRYPTVGLLGMFIKGDAGAEEALLVPLQPEGTRQPLFCLHGHQGHVHSYVSLAQIIGPDQPLYGLQSVGQQENGSPDSTIEAIASLYIGKIKTVQPTGPYAIAGFCYGGVIALEMAHQLQRSGETVSHLLMFDVTPAEFKELMPQNIVSSYYDYVKRSRHRRFLTSLRELSLREKMFTILRTGLRNITPMFRRQQDVSPSQSYSPRPFAGRVTLFLSRETTAAYASAPSSVWNVLGTAGVDVILCSGEEGVMFSQPHVQHLSNELHRLLSK